MAISISIEPMHGQLIFIRYEYLPLYKYLLSDTVWTYSDLRL